MHLCRTGVLHTHFSTWQRCWEIIRSYFNKKQGVRLDDSIASESFNCILPVHLVINESKQDYLYLTSYSSNCSSFTFIISAERLSQAFWGCTRSQIIIWSPNCSRFQSERASVLCRISHVSSLHLIHLSADPRSQSSGVKGEEKGFEETQACADGDSSDVLCYCRWKAYFYDRFHLFQRQTLSLKCC